MRAHSVQYFAEEMMELPHDGHRLKAWPRCMVASWASVGFWMELKGAFGEGMVVVFLGEIILGPDQQSAGYTTVGFLDGTGQTERWLGWGFGEYHW